MNSSNNNLLNGVEELWNDKSVTVLFGPLPNMKNEQYTAISNFWELQITRRREVLGPDALQFSLETLQRDFRYRGMIPMSLPTVLLNMEKKGKIIRLGKNSFELQKTQEGWIMWTYNTFIAKP